MEKQSFELPQSDPKLKDAVSEIEAICKKYGIGATITLASSTHAEFKVIMPDWSGLQMEGKNFRVKLHHTEPQKTDATIHLAHVMRDMSGLMFQNFEAAIGAISQHFEIEHRPFTNLWDMDGWRKPDLDTAPHKVIDYKKRRKPKGFKQL